MNKLIKYFKYFIFYFFFGAISASFILLSYYFVVWENPQEDAFIIIRISTFVGSIFSVLAIIGEVINDN